CTTATHIALKQKLGEGLADPFAPPAPRGTRDRVGLRVSTGVATRVLDRPYGSRRSPMGRAVEPFVILARLMGLPASSGSISDPPSPAARAPTSKPPPLQRGFFDAAAVASIPRLMPSRSPPARAAAPDLPRDRAATARRGRRAGERKPSWHN